MWRGDYYIHVITEVFELQRKGGFSRKRPDGSWYTAGRQHAGYKMIHIDEWVRQDLVEDYVAEVGIPPVNSTLSGGVKPSRRFVALAPQV
jgi:hypothetical protein